MSTECRSGALFHFPNPHIRTPPFGAFLVPPAPFIGHPYEDMHMRLSAPHMLRGFALGSGIALLLFAADPLQAQTTNIAPTPAPTSPELRVLDEIAQRLETMSASNTTTINGAALMMGGAFFVLMLVVLVVTVWVARGGLQPLFATLNREQRRADAAEQSETSMRVISDSKEKAAAEVRKQMAASLDHQATTLDKVTEKLMVMEGTEQAQKRTDTAAGRIITEVNAHTDQTISDAKEKLEKAAAQVEQAAKTIDDVVTKDHLSNELKPIREELHDIAVTLRKKGDTSPLPPLSSITDADPSAPAAPEPEA